MGGATYVVVAMALGTAAAVDSDGFGFSVAAIAATFPSCLILYPLLYPVIIRAGMAASMSIDGSGPYWVIVTLCFGVAAVLNVLLVRLVVVKARPCWARLRRLVSRA
jgi:hypothetical protein